VKQYKRKHELIQNVEYFAKFDQVTEKLEAKYGLPSEVKFCKKCVISNQRPNSVVEYKHIQKSKKQTITLDEEGICDACRANEQKKEIIDWEQRENELIELCDRYRKNDGSYDCMVPGSGGKDSFYQAHILKHKYKMNPLTVTWAPHIYTEWGWKNFQGWLGAGFDNYLMTPNPRMHRLMTRLAVENLFHPFQPFMFGQKALAPKMAAKFDISLIFYGENEAEYGNPVKENTSAQRDWSYFSGEKESEIYLGGVSLHDLYDSFGVNKVDLDPYMPINPMLLEEKKIEVHYLGYYLPWHPQGAYYYAVEHGDFQASPERTPGTYSKYNSIDDKIDDFHYYTTFIKFGIGRATYDASQEVRNDEITRDEGVTLVRKYDGEFPERFADEIFKYLSIPEKEFPVASKMFEQSIMDRDYFNSLTDSFRSPHLWKKENGTWKLRHTVWNNE
jgi:N-acetyl sugar amidotransferase